MKSRWRYPHRLAAYAGGLSLALGLGCDIMGPDLEGRGTIRYVDLEGGCWGLLTDEDLFEPINLASEFRVDGLLVVFEAERREDMASPCMMGPIVELSKIRRANP